MIKSVNVRTHRASSAYKVSIEAGLLQRTGDLATKVLRSTGGRIAIISNSKVYGHYGKAVESSLTGSGFKVFVHLIGDGERFKNLRTLERSLLFLNSSGIGRTDAVIALGGGVVGDLAGFAAAVYLRGVKFFQIPTTLLAMIDSSVGGKTGVNSVFGKNLIGAFHQPSGVVIDPLTLKTLPRRQLTAGLCEAIKHGAVGERELFNSTAELLDGLNLTSPGRNSRIDEQEERLAAFLVSQVRFKAMIVSGDETESPDRTDARSRKILNFGHTFGHALERVTKFRYFLHGEAVGHGIRFAAALSKNLGLLSKDDVELLYDVVHRAGPLPPIAKIDPKQIFSSFKFDKKNLDGSLNWVLLRKIGQPVIIPDSELSQAAQLSAFREIVRP
ncbi:MAG TPA: 3-dehydroquinate synthase [Pyrinomonadaceae bacterium]|nr:3-dehydroquinate synthase [Pyrinomonadaceae bacterium]